MKRLITAGATDQTVYVFIQDSASTTGGGKTGIAYNAASLVCYYVRDLAAAAALTLATQTVTGAHSDGGFVEVDATNMPGVYRLDLSDAVCAAGVSNVVVMLKGASGMVPLPLEIQLGGGTIATATSVTNIVTANATQLAGQTITAAAGVTFPSSVASPTNITAATGVTLTPTTGLGNQTANITGTVSTVTTVTNQLTAAQIATGVWQDATAGDFTAASSIGKALYVANVVPGAAGGHFIAGTNAATSITTALTANITGNLSGSVGSVTGAVGSVTGAVGSVTGAVGSVTGAVGSVTGAVGSVTGNVGGNVTGSVGSVAAGGITAASIADGAIDNATFAADVGSTALATNIIAKAAEKAIGVAGLSLTAIPTIAAVTTVTNLTNAPTAGDLTATMKTSVTTAATAATPTAAAVTGAVGSVTSPVTVGTNNDKAGYALTATTGLGNQTANITGNLSGSVGSVTGAVGSVTGAVGSVTGLTAAHLDVAVSTRLATAGYTAPLDAAGTRTAVGLATANLDTQLADLPTAAENATALLDASNGVETGLTPREALRLTSAALAGKISGAETTTVVIRNTADTKDRITATVDADGNRTAITTDLT